MIDLTNKAQDLSINLPRRGLKRLVVHLSSLGFKEFCGVVSGNIRKREFMKQESEVQFHWRIQIILLLAALLLNFMVLSGVRTDKAITIIEEALEKSAYMNNS